MIEKLGKSQREKNLRQVASVAAFKDGKILMGLRGDVRKWCLPGGHLEPDESPAKGAVRELLEETGLKTKSLERLGSAIVGKKGNVQVHCYRADVDGSPDASNDPDAEMIEFRWVDPDDIPEDILSNLYNKQDVTLQLLGAQPKTIDLSKASLAEIMARTKVTADHMRALAQSGATSHVFPHPSGGTVVVARDPSKPGKYRATRIDAAGEPIGHIEAEDIHGAIRHAHSYGADVHAVQPIQKAMGEWLAKAQRPQDFKSILNATTPEGRTFVDHKTQLHAHPMDMAPSVEHYENNIKAHPQVFKPTRGSRDEGVTRKLIFNSRDQSIDHNVFDHPDKYMVKPYHEGIVRRISSWQKYPIQGWAEMANQALYHAAGIGDLHQKVHVSEHDMKSPKLGHAPGEPALVVHMENGMKPAHAVGNIVRDINEKPVHDCMKIGLMDFLTNNLDRHHGNLLMEAQEQPKLPPEANAPAWLRDETVNKVSRVMAIDHSRSFQYVNNHHHKWDSQAKVKKVRQLEDSIRPYLFGGNSWRPAVSSLIPRPRTHSEKVEFLQTHAKPLFDWWEKSSPKIRAAFHDQLEHIKHPEAKAHLRRNFEERARWLDERADLGIDNYGTDWYDDPVAQYHPDQKTDGEVEDQKRKDAQEQYARDLAELNGKRGAA